MTGTGCQVILELHGFAGRGFYTFPSSFPLLPGQVKGAISTVAEASVMVSCVVSNNVVQPQHCLGNPGFIQLIVSVTEDMPWN